MADAVRPWKYVVRGMPLPYRVLDSNIQGVLDLEVRKDDVIIASYPKSGTNWLRNIINYMLDCPEDQNNLSLPIELSASSSASQEGLATAPSVVKMIQSWTSPRVVYTHLLPHLLPAQLFEKNAKVVYICRNPKDVAVSYFHFSQMVRVREPRSSTSSLEEYMPRFMQGAVPYGSYFTHVKEYLKLRHRDIFLLVRYEDLKKNERGVMRQLGSFLGRDLDEQKVSDISDHCSMERMRLRFSETQQAMSTIIDQERGDFFRKGKVGDWRDCLGELHVTRFDQLFEEHLGDSGLNFDSE